MPDQTISHPNAEQLLIIFLAMIIFSLTLNVQGDRVISV